MTLWNIRQNKFMLFQI